MTITTDPNHPELQRGSDETPREQNLAYLVLSQAERDKGFIRPVRNQYTHKVCGVVTRMHSQIAETYARDPKFYGSTWCIRCAMHRPVSEFFWDDGSILGS